MQYACVSHIGKLRRINQDNFICDGKYLNLNENNCLFRLSGKIKLNFKCPFGIFDGMGGEECGEVASFIASKTAAEFEFKYLSSKEMYDFCMMANQNICDYARENSVRTMGTTAAMIGFGKNKIVYCNIGDSKIFLFQKNKLQQISKDHVFPAPYGKKSPLTQCLGIPSDEMIIEPYINTSDYIENDRYLICSDGLTDMVSLNEIENMMNMSSLDDAIQKLCESAIDNGGRDNITIMLFEIKRKKIMNLLRRK